MNKLNGDGNLFGRITALAVLVAVIAGIGRICGISVCPMSSCSSCPASAAPHQ